MFASAAAPRPADLMISGGLLIAALVEALITHSTKGPTWLVVAVSIVTIVPLAWRRTYPLPAVLAAVIAIVVPVALGLQADGLALAVANLVAVHAVNAYADLTTAAIGTLTMGAAHLVSVVTSDNRVPGDLIWTSVFILLARAVARSLRRPFGLAGQQLKPPNEKRSRPNGVRWRPTSTTSSPMDWP